MVGRLTNGEEYTTIKSFLRQDYEGMEAAMDLMYASLSAASAIVEDHPDLTKSDASIITIGLELYRSIQPPSPEREGEEENGSYDRSVGSGE